MRNSEIAIIIGILRRVTTMVKVLPFLGAVCYLFGIIGYLFLPEVALDVIDLLFYLSPLCMTFLLILSKTLHLCGWHRFECVLPFIASIPFIVDRYIVPISPYANVDVIGIIIIFSASLINAYFVFLKPRVK